MVNVKKGVLITCDPALIQFVKYLDEKRELGKPFIIKELDETHLFVEKEILSSLEQRIDLMMDQLTSDQS